MPTETTATSEKVGVGARLSQSGNDAEVRREAARVMGSSTSEAKAAAARLNGLRAKRQGRPVKPPEQCECTCGRGDALEGHPTTCPRGLAIYRQRKREAEKQ